MLAIDIFLRWWNSLAAKNGKLKFSNRRQAAEFVRRVQNENGGPNAKIIEMRRRYNSVNNAKRSADAAEPSRNRNTAIYN
jgi:hypothetical protein